MTVQLLRNPEKFLWTKLILHDEEVAICQNECCRLT